MVPHETPCPRDALTAAEAECGTPVELKEISNRRGSAVWKGTGPDGTVAVKTGYDDGASVTTREAAVLEALDLQDYAIGSGVEDGVSWLVTRWFTGPSTWAAFKSVRDRAEGSSEALAAAVSVSNQLSDPMQDVVSGTGSAHRGAVA